MFNTYADRQKRGHLTHKDLEEHLKRTDGSRVKIQKGDLALLFNLYDKKNTTMIRYVDFVEELSPKGKSWA